jgi:hypothetical protein
VAGSCPAGDLPSGPTADELRAILSGPGALGGTDRSYEMLRAATAPAIDPARRAHRAALHRWLNAWGCRIRYPQPGEADLFDRSLAAWWRHRAAGLGPVHAPLAELSDDEIDVIAEAYVDLSAAAVAVDARGHARTMGPTAAAKCLYALRPRSVMPWDLMIAERLHGGRDRQAFAGHLRLGRRWARDLLASSGLGEAALLADLDRPGATLAKVLDEYCYLRYTFRRPGPAAGATGHPGATRPVVQ